LLNRETQSVIADEPLIIDERDVASDIPAILHHLGKMRGPQFERVTLLICI